MRPRVFPAEDELAGSAGCAGPGASMRPRVFPAEDKTAASSASKAADELQ